MANNKNINTDFVTMLPISQSLKRIDSTVSNAFPASAHAWPAILNILALLLCGLFMKLGFWQIDRAHQRENLIQHHAQRLARAPFPLDQLLQNPADANDKCVELTGRFLNEFNFVVDNRIWHGQPGFTIITPLKANGVILLVDRGWLPLNGHERVIPEIPPGKDSQELTACAYLQAGKPFLLKPDDYAHATWPMLVQSIDISQLQKTVSQQRADNSHANQTIPPFILRQESALTIPLVRDDPVATLSADRNYGYALQWFSFSVVLLIITLTLDLKYILKVRQ